MTRSTLIFVLLLVASTALSAPIVWDAKVEPCSLSEVCAAYYEDEEGSCPEDTSAIFECRDNGKGIQRVSWKSKTVTKPTRVQLDAIKATAAKEARARSRSYAAEDASEEPDIKTFIELGITTKAAFKAGYTNANEQG